MVPAPSITTIAALAIAAIAIVGFAADARPQLGHGMTGFDSTWYHGPFAAGFFGGGDTWSLHLIAPQFMAWFYPANSEVFHSIGMLAFERDLLSPLLNVGWFAGCLLALWCIGRPFGVPLFTLVLGAVALRQPAFADQAGEARNDIVGTFFLLAGVALALNAPKLPPRRVRTSPRIARESANSLALAGLAVGMAAGTKLNFLLPAAVLALGLALVAPRGARLRAAAITVAAAVAGGGYWYLRNLAHAGNPLPWVGEIGPLSLPAPDQPLGGREGHSVLGYLTDGTVWADWLLPGLRDGLGVLFPLICLLAAAGLVLCLLMRSDPPVRVAAAAGLATALAWLVAPTSASGPEGLPRGFESGLRYLIPALTLGLALLPLAPLWRDRLAELSSRGAEGRPDRRILKVPASLGRHLSERGTPRTPLAAALVALLLLAAIAIGYPVQRHYLEGRYADPSFTTPGLNAAFEWSRSLSGVRIATTSTRQYPLFGTDLSNTVEFVGIERPHGGFVAPETCPEWRRLLNEGGYDYVVASRDRIEPERPPFPPTARWTEGPEAKIVLKEPPTVVFELTKPLDVSACGRAR